VRRLAAPVRRSASAFREHFIAKRFAPSETRERRYLVRVAGGASRNQEALRSVQEMNQLERSSTMRSQQKIAVAVAALAIAGIARASDYVDIGTAQQRAETGIAPTGVEQTIRLAEPTRAVSHQLGEAQQVSQSGEGYTPAPKPAALAGHPGPSAVAPTFGIGEAQQLAETGEGYVPADSTHAVTYASVAR
jgi:hypothetical protein